jgi:hypothetical protein
MGYPFGDVSTTFTVVIASPKDAGSRFRCVRLPGCPVKPGDGDLGICVALLFARQAGALRKLALDIAPRMG